VGSNLPPATMDISHPATTLMPRGQPLTQTLTIDGTMPFRVHISRDVEVSLMNLQVFLTLQIPISGLTPTLPVLGPIATMLIAGSHARIGVHCSNVPLGHAVLCARSFWQSVGRWCTFTVVGTTAAQSVLGCDINIVWTGMPMTSRIVTPACIKLIL
jgi:hypothetical protein